MGATDFEFGWNVADNADPWASQNRADDRQAKGRRPEASGNEGSTPSDSSALSEFHEITCGQVLKMVRQMTDTVRKATRMLPSSSGNSGTGAPRQQRRNGPSFLSAEHLSKTPKAAKIMSVKLDLEHRWGPCISVKIAMDGQSYLWTVSIKKNPNYRLLEQKFGNDENDWVGQPILLGLEQDEHTEQWFPRVTFPETRTGKKG